LSVTFSAISATAPLDSLCFFFAGPMVVVILNEWNS
jgi:hypothetical protein